MSAQPGLESSSREVHLKQMQTLDRHWEEVSQSIQRAEQQLAAFQRCLANARYIRHLEAAETISPSALLVKRVVWLEEQVAVLDQRLQEHHVEQARLEHGFDVARRQLVALQRYGRERRALRRQHVARFLRLLCRGLVLMGHLLLCGPPGAKPPEGITWEGGRYWW